MPRKATHDQVELFLRLYELRREAKLRTARDWFVRHAAVESLEDLQRVAPPGSEENAYLRMVAGYWEMACDLLNQGLLPEELFFKHAGEFYAVWERLEPLAKAFRQTYRNPHFFAEIEKAARRYEKWMERRAPGSLAELRRMRRAMLAPARPAAS